MIEIKKCPKCGEIPRVVSAFQFFGFQDSPKMPVYTMLCKSGFQCCRYACNRISEDENDREIDKEEIERLITNYNQWVEDGGKFVYRGSN